MSDYLQKRMAHILADRPLKVKEYKPIARISEKRKLKLKELSKDDNAMDIWFEERRKEMKGFCVNCGKKSCKDDDEKYHFSLAHILPKAYFESVATHPLNYLELCFWGENSCHTQMDNKMLDLMDMNCFDEIVTKFVAIYPMIDKKERKRIPQVLLNYIEVEI